jgi:hypothetical protein
VSANNYGDFLGLAALPNETTLRTLNLGAGSYYVHGQAFIDNTAGVLLNLRCFLRLSPGVTGLGDGQFQDVASAHRVWLDLGGAVTVGAGGGSVSVACNKQSAAEAANAGARIAAIQVGSTTVTALTTSARSVAPTSQPRMKAASRKAR